MKTCPVCQKLVNDETKFCYYCGASLMNLAPEMPAPESVPEEQTSVEDAAPSIEPEPVAIEEPTASEEPAAIEEPAAEESAPVEAPTAETSEPIVIGEPVKAEPTPASDEQPAAAEAPVAPPAPAPVVNATDSRSLMTTAGYIFSTILFHIPVIGLIFLFIWGCGRPKNISLKRYSLAWLIMRLLGIIFILSCTVFVLICYSGKFPILTQAFTEFFS